MNYTVALIGETIENQLSSAAPELCTISNELLRNISGDAVMILPGEDMQETANICANEMGFDVIAIENKYLRHPNIEILTETISIYLEKNMPQYICLNHSAVGIQLAAALSIKLNTSCISSVESIRFDGPVPVFRRSTFGGKLNSEVTSKNVPVIITILPGAFSAPEQNEFKPGKVTIIPSNTESRYININGIKKETESNSRLEEADTIVAAGRGIENKENLELLRELAELFPQSAIGASRPVCDQGWLPYSHQVGQTGKKVSPRLYIACGISGTYQHIVGMKNAQTIVAINSDPKAAIHSFADYSIVEDLNSFLPLLIEKFREQNS